MENYTDIQLYTHWKFKVPRQNNGSPIVLVVDRIFEGDPKKDTLVIMDVRRYRKDEERVFKPVLAIDFFALYHDKNFIEEYIPLP